MEKPSANVVVSLVGLPLNDRPGFFATLLSRLQELRVQTGRPHWILVDETHHLLPVDWEPAPTVLTQELTGMIYVTVHPGSVSRAVLATVTTVAALGEDPAATLDDFARAVGRAEPHVTGEPPAAGEALLWVLDSGEPPFMLRVAPSESDRTRHRLKYAEGALPPDRSFYFRGPGKRLNLRAQNLVLFSQIADCVDDVASAHYNTVVDKSRVPAVDWNSAEHMRDVGQYQIGVIVSYNASPPVKGRGSCIFLHIWRGPQSPTVGCTALDVNALVEIMRWLAPLRTPVLVQLPRQVYDRVRAEWDLP